MFINTHWNVQVILIAIRFCCHFCVCWLLYCLTQYDCATFHYGLITVLSDPKWLCVYFSMCWLQYCLPQWLCDISLCVDNSIVCPKMTVCLFQYVLVAVLSAPMAGLRTKAAVISSTMCWDPILELWYVCSSCWWFKYSKFRLSRFDRHQQI